MLKVTISTQAGETVTTTDPTEAWQFLVRHATDRVAALLDAGRFHRLMLWNNWLEAGNLAEEHGLNFAIANAAPEIHGVNHTATKFAAVDDSYTVPVDPADATQCDGCQ